MSKRGQTTEAAKAGQKKPAESASLESAPKKARPSKREEYRSRAEREAQIQRYVILGTGFAVAVVAVILVIALVIDQIIAPNQVVASVNGQNITVGQFQKRVRLERVFRIQQLSNYYNFLQSVGYPADQVSQLITQEEPYTTLYNELQNPDRMGLAVVEDMVEDELIRQAAVEQGVTVTQDQIQEQINQFFGYDPEAIAAAESTAEATATVEPSATPTPFVSPTPSPTPTITPTPEFTPTASTTPQPTASPEPTLSGTQQAEQFNTTKNDVYNQLRSQTGMSDTDINAYFELQALRKALRDAVTPEITTTGPFVDARHILVATEEEAQDIIAALQDGESFAELARAVSTDTSNSAQGGELGWSPASQYVKPFADAVVSAEIGEVVGPIETEFGFHVIQVRAREDRELTDDQVEQAKNTAFQAWLDELKTAKADQTQRFDNTWFNNVPTDPVSPFS